MSAPATLSEAWQAHADRELPIDASQAQVIRHRRDWYAAQLDLLLAAKKTPQNQALLAEAIGFGRMIGTAAERAAA